MKIYSLNSPNFNKRKRSVKSIKFIIIHYTGMQSERESLFRLLNPKSKVSSHFVINKRGKIYRMVNENKIAWHAGKSCWGRYRNLNKNSIGIELTNKGHEFGYTDFHESQISSLIKICKQLIKKYKIKKKDILGHSDIAPLRKIDPGEKFPWKRLAEKKIGIWHTCNQRIVKKFRNVKIFAQKDKKKFINSLKKIGYFASHKNKYHFFKTVKAFQRHYRGELINGFIDKECVIIAQNLSKRL